LVSTLRKKKFLDFLGFGFELSSFEFHKLAISVLALFFKFKDLPPSLPPSLPPHPIQKRGPIPCTYDYTLIPSCRNYKDIEFYNKFKTCWICEGTKFNSKLD
jgi:hypothetical protein